MLSLAATLALAITVPVPAGAARAAVVLQASDTHLDQLRGVATEVRARLDAGDLELARAMLTELADELAEWEPGRAAERAPLEELDGHAERIGALDVQLAARTYLVALAEAVFADEPSEVDAARGRLSLTYMRLGQTGRAAEILGGVVARLEARLDENDLELLRAQGNYANVLRRQGRLEEALALDERVTEGFELMLPPGDPLIEMALGNLAESYRQVGQLERSIELDRRVVAMLAERGQEPELTRARHNLALSLYGARAYEEARELLEVVVARLEELLPPGAADTWSARESLASVLSKLGHAEEAFALRSAVAREYERRLPPDHPDLLLARSNLAASASDLGDLDLAYELETEVLLVRERTLPAGHPALVHARSNLGARLLELGDPARARGLIERALADNERRLPEGHPQILQGRMNLASACAELGDLDTARELQERVLAAREAALGRDHIDSLRARLALAATLQELGRLAAARDMLEQLVADAERTRPPRDPLLLLVREYLAAVLVDLGELEVGIAIQADIVAAREERLARDHPALLAARANLAQMHSRAGALDVSRALFEASLQEYDRGWAAEDSAPLSCRLGLLTDLHRAGADRGDLLFDQVRAQRRRLELALLQPPREARALTAREGGRIDGLLALEALPAERRAIAELTEWRRHVAGGGRRLVGGSAEGRELQRELRACSGELNDVVLTGPRDGEPPAEWRARIVDLSRARDGIVKELRALDPERSPPVLSAAAIVAALPDHGAAIGFTRYDRWRLGAERSESGGAASGVSRGHPAYLAHVFHADGVVARVELGPADVIDVLVEAWRAAIGTTTSAGRAVEPGRGQPLESAAGPSVELAAGRALRAATLDRVFEAAGVEPGAQLYVCLDDALHLAPLDALPLEEADLRVGDRYTVHVEVSFARLVSAPRERRGTGLLLVGDVDFDARDAPARLADGGHFVSPPLSLGVARGAAFGRWSRLAATAVEVEAIAEQFRATHPDVAAPVVLTGGAATKAALATAVAGKRYVHLATHGWFAPEAVFSTADVSRSVGEGLPSARLESTVRGFAPMTLCGLCLSGANAGADAAGRVLGLLTAEELAAQDLGACELAVLSACETHVGVRAGQGVLSLQTALHAAGARSAVTSLWRVSDERTMELMRAFYEALWERGAGKAEALWSAKSRLRASGHPVAAWAAWVLTGDPR